ncbi:SET domain-containing protein 3 [Kickxella alabastrina]|uniref:SET domain-containing protein 3 n=1 Tax=Kickxella alabastrina TaxID=61397 RepID=A0ACC1INA6_9FUNG|nr:SET domain-containing protein 3 [Kickxella alabastrina]
MSMRLSDKGRDGSLIVDHSYTPIDRNILGTDVQVLFQSVLSQLAEQRSVVSTAAASVTSQTPLSGPTSAAGAVPLSAETAEPTAKTEIKTEPNIEPTAKSVLLVVPALGSSDGCNSLPIHRSSSKDHLRTPSPPPPPPSPLAAGVKVNGAALPPMIPMTDVELASPLPVYRLVVGKDRGQVGLFARDSIRRHQYICEYKGQVLLKAAYKEDPKNYYELLRITRPHSHFHPKIDLCIDARRQGSDARFVRRSCDANVALKSIFIPESSDSLIHLGLFASRDVGADEELTIDWEWEDGELPAVSRMSPADAEDYLGRPEGRRMSKVWRQAFGGMTCACADTDCGVRKLFATLGVEESVVRPDFGSGGVLKRRVSRPFRVDTGNGDVGDQAPSSPQVQSPDGFRSVRSPHSRKGSTASMADGAPGSPVALVEGGPNAWTDSFSASRDSLSIFSVRRTGHGGSSRKRSADVTLGGKDSSSAALDDDDEDEVMDDEANCGGNDANGSAAGTVPMNRRQSSSHSATSNSSSHGVGGDSRSRSRSQSRKRKPSAQHESKAVGKDAAIGSGGFAVGADSSSSSKKSRSVSGAPLTSRKSSTNMPMLPLKKLWMTQYLEHAEQSAEAPGNDFLAVAGPDVSNTVSAQDNAKAEDVIMADPDEIIASSTVVALEEATAPLDINPIMLPEHVHGHGQVKTVPTDADAPTPTPTDPIALIDTLSGADTVDSIMELPSSAAFVAAAAQSESKNADGSTAADQPDSNAEPAANGPDAADGKSATAAPVKKQRLSLEDYKKRRVNTVTSPSKDSDAKDRASDVGSERQPDAADSSAPADEHPEPPVTSEAPLNRAKLSLEEYIRRRKPSGTFSADGESITDNTVAEKESLSVSAVAGAATTNQLVAVPSSEADKPEQANASVSAPSLSPLAIRSLPETARAVEPVAPQAAITSRITRSPMHPISAPMPTRPGEAASKRGVLSPPPPPPPSNAATMPVGNRIDDRSNGPSNGQISIAGSAGRGGNAPNTGGGEPHYRFERGPNIHDSYERDRERGPPGHGAYRPREREREREREHYDGSAERESGEIGLRRDFVRSRSRDRGGRVERMPGDRDRDRDRDRRHNTFSGVGNGPGHHHQHQHQQGHGHHGYGQHPAQAGSALQAPVRSSTPHGSDGGRSGSQRGGDWRAGGYAAQRLSPSPARLAQGIGARAMTMSPDRHQQPSQPPFSSSAMQHGQLPGLSVAASSASVADGYHRGGSSSGSGGSRRTGGVSSTNASRGGSPSRK